MPDSTSPAQQTSSTSLEGLDPAERLLSLWERGEKVDLEAFLQATPATAAQLSDVLQLDQCRRWECGDRVLAESYLDRYERLREDREAAVDLIFQEFLLRERFGEQPQATEYTTRFPAFAEVLSQQIALHLALATGRVRASAPDATASFVRKGHARGERPGDGPSRFLARRGPLSSYHVQSLLRTRLRLLSMITGLAFLLYLPVLWAMLVGTWGTLAYGIVVAESAIFAILLSGSRTFSLPLLRGMELCLFGGLMLFFIWETTEFFRVDSLAKLAPHGWVGSILAARNVSWSWAVMIIVYAIGIPNTIRRSTIIVAAMTATFLAIVFGLALRDAGTVPANLTSGFLLCSSSDMAFACAIALFGAYRIETLQRAASETRRLGPYHVIKRIGAGGMGEVYLARHALLRRPCALKVIRGEHVGDARLLSRFEREVQAMATLSHPNTVRIYDYGLADDGTFYYAMEYVPGWSLDELVRRDGPLPAARVVFLLRQICGALAEAHGVGLVHRDIKPGNVLVCASGGIYDMVKLLDFGLVRLLSTQAPAGDALTELGTSAGTPAFMSPEQAAGEFDLDARTDIYSLGAVAYFLLTGRPPFIERTSVQTMTAHITAAVVPPSQRQPDIPNDLDRIVVRCLEKDLARRFGDVTSLDKALASTACACDWSSQAAAEWWSANVRRDATDESAETGLEQDS